VSSHILSLWVSLEVFKLQNLLSVAYSAKDVISVVAVTSPELGRQESQIFSISDADLLYQ